MSVINTNITSMIGQQNLSKSQNDLQTSMERLSSGLRINSAKDDAAGQAIANRMSSQITGLATAQRNANDGISVAQTAEGALNQVNDNLQRVRELAVQAENGTNSQNDLESIQNEINQRLGEINRISDETSFNDTKVLQTGEGMKIQVGANDGEAITIDLKEINVETLGMEGFNVTGAGEIDNEAATVDDLALADAIKQGDTNEYVLSTDNKEASTSDVLGNVSTENSEVSITNGPTFTVNADGNFEQSQTFDALDAGTNTGADAIADRLTPANAGETVEATVTIGTESTDISVSSDGAITHADSGNTLYLDDTGNLTENNGGSISAATVDSLSESLATQNGAVIEFADESTITTGAFQGVAGSDGTSIGSAANLLTELSDAAGGDAANERAEVSITVGGESVTAYVGNDGIVSASNDDGTDAGVTVGGVNIANENELYAALQNDRGSVEITAAGTSGNTTNVGNTYDAVFSTALAGEEVSDATVADAVKAAAGGDVTMSIEVEDDEGTVLGTQSVTATGAAGDAKDLRFGAFADTADGDASDALGASADTVYLSADDGSLTGSDTTNVSYYAQENGNVTNDSGQRIYVDQDDNFTTEETTEAERSSLSDVDDALSTIDSFRSDLGAIQNRMESAIENLSTTETNLSAARSRIEDADYAVEVANMTKNQILQQAGTSVLAQANQLPQNVLSLLG